MTFYKTHLLTICCSTAIGTLASTAHAVSSAELYTTESYPYGRFEARVQYAGGDGIVGSFFLWKEASEEEDVFWNELDVETVWADCELLTNALYGLPEVVHSESAGTSGNYCGSFHTYAYEWTPDYVAWFVDGTEIRRETGADSQAFRDNAPDMQIHFNVWPGDSTFGGNFNPAILPVYEYINWVQYYSYADGEFQLEWREDFGSGTLPEGWATGDWDSPKGLSTHSPDNVAFIDGYAVLSMTADDATGSAGAAPMDPEGGGPITEVGEEDDPAADDAEEMTDDAAPADDGVMDDSAPDDDAPDSETPSDSDPEGELPGDDEGAMDDGNVPMGSGGSGGMPSAEVPAEMVGDTVPPGSGGAGGSSPAAEGAGGSGNGTAEQPVAGGQAGAPESGGSPVTSAPSNTGGAATMTPSGATSAPSATGTGPAPSTVAPMAVQSDVGNDDGGCRMTGKDASNNWGWVALVLGLSLGGIRRSTRTSNRWTAHRTE